MKKIIFGALTVCALFFIFGCDGVSEDGPVTISFDLYYHNAPQPPQSVTIESNEQIGGNLPIPEREGFVFLGWFRYNADGEWIPVEAAATFPFSTTLYARWEEFLLITFNLNYLFAPPAPESVTLEVDEQIGGKLPPDPAERDGFTFLGWFRNTSADGWIPVEADDTFSANTTVYAQWEDNREDITISFDLNYPDAPQPPDNVTIKGGDMITFPNLPGVAPRPGFWRFRGWSTAESGGEPVERTTRFDSDITLYARWAAIVGFELDVTNYYKGTTAEEFYGGAYGAPLEYVIEADGSLTAEFPEPDKYISNGNVMQGMFINLTQGQRAIIEALPDTTTFEIVIDATSIPDTTPFRYFLATDPTRGENWNATVTTDVGPLSEIYNQTVSFSTANYSGFNAFCFLLQIRGASAPPTTVNIKSITVLWEDE